MNLEDLKIGDIVNIVYETYNNNGGKRRNLKNLRIEKFYNAPNPIFNRIEFTQLGEKPRNFQIPTDSILKIKVN